MGVLQYLLLRERQNEVTFHHHPGSKDTGGSHIMDRSDVQDPLSSRNDRIHPCVSSAFLKNQQSYAHGEKREPSWWCIDTGWTRGTKWNKTNSDPDSSSEGREQISLHLHYKYRKTAHDKCIICNCFIFLVLRTLRWDRSPFRSF